MLHPQTIELCQSLIRRRWSDDAIAHHLKMHVLTVRAIRSGAYFSKLQERERRKADARARRAIAHRNESARIYHEIFAPADFDAVISAARRAVEDKLARKRARLARERAAGAA